MEENKEVMETAEKKMEQYKTLPNEIQEKTNKAVFQEIAFAIVIMIYFYFINLGFLNIERGVYVVDLEVFSLCLLALAIFLFEKAYKKDSGKIALHGIEILVLAFCTLTCIYLCIFFNTKYILIMTLLAFLYAIYYVIKAVIVQHNIVKEYKKSSSDIQDIIKKDITRKEAKKKAKPTKEENEN